MRKSTERALRWFLERELKVEKFALEARLESRNTKAAHEKEPWEAQKLKRLLRAIQEEEELDNA